MVEVGHGRGEPAEAATGARVVKVDDGTEQRPQSRDIRDGLCGVECVEDGAFAGADAVLDGAIVGWPMDRAVDWQDAPLGEEAVDDVRIEGRAIVALEEERRAVAGDETAEPAQVFEGGLGAENQGLEVVMGGQVAGKNNDDARVGGSAPQ